MENIAVNKKIKNKYITHKIVEYEKIIPKDIGLKTEMNTVDFNRFENEKENYIKYRQEKIADLVYDHFPLATVMLVK